MPYVIHKHQLITTRGNCPIIVRGHPQILTAGFQGYTPVVWVAVDPEAVTERCVLRIKTIFTGDPLPPPPARYLQTIQRPDGIVVHVFNMGTARPKVVECPHCDFGSGYQGINSCGECKGTGSLLTYRNQWFDNTKKGYNDCLEAIVEDFKKNGA